MTSVNYPYKYASISRCRWHIHTEPATYVSLTFLDFDIPTVGNCNDDRLRIYDGGTSLNTPLLGRFCNSKPPPGDIDASFNEMYITFNTDDNIEGRGFQAEYHARTFKLKDKEQSNNGKQYCWVLTQHFVTRA